EPSADHRAECGTPSAGTAGTVRRTGPASRAAAGAAGAPEGSGDPWAGPAR
ncbi:hypothetical protein NBJODN_NBJODN_09670, partial [Dysosmobacter welbionis]